MGNNGRLAQRLWGNFCSQSLGVLGDVNKAGTSEKVTFLSRPTRMSRAVSLISCDMVESVQHLLPNAPPPLPTYPANAIDLLHVSTITPFHALLSGVYQIFHLPGTPIS
jgi:hypothetical protein